MITIAIQFYWNYINYKNNRTELINQIQLSLDNSIDAYYGDMVRGHDIQIVTTADSIGDRDSSDIKKVIRHFNTDASFASDTTVFTRAESFSFSTHKTKMMTFTDSVEINILASKLFVSVNQRNIDIERLSEILEADFTTKNWTLDYGLEMINEDCLNPIMNCDSIVTYGDTKLSNQLSTVSQSALIPPGSTLTIYFSNITSILLRKSMLGIGLSLLLAAIIIFCLLYLFKVIKNQKQLAEIKDDLISNITHEFKTPITTIHAALEGISSFDVLNDKDRTRKYIDISSQQLSKLNTMVEKLLETASLDSQHLELNKEPHDIIDIIQHQLEKNQVAFSNLNFEFHTDTTNCELFVDKFHIDSAIANLLDNAAKYGGNSIEINCKTTGKSVQIEVRDNGPGIPKDKQSKIFDKFYRIPTGNIHDVKGFGIGLYYTRNIIEKHGGSLALTSDKYGTIFTIRLPNEN